MVIGTPMLLFLFLIMLQLSPPIIGHQRSGGHRRSRINQPLYLAKQDGAISGIRPDIESNVASLLPPPPPSVPFPEDKTTAPNGQPENKVVPAPRRVWKTTRANILWRAVDHEDLRAHPLYVKKSISFPDTESLIHISLSLNSPSPISSLLVP